VIPIAPPFTVVAGESYSVGLFPTTGFLSVLSTADSYSQGEAFFIHSSAEHGIFPSADLTFELRFLGPNYIDQMDRYQERNEGSAQQVARRLFMLGGRTAYAQELWEQLDRSTWTHYQTSRDSLMSTLFIGGWYETGSTILDLLDEAGVQGWRASFPGGSSPIGTLESSYGPLSQAEAATLLQDAQQAYGWQDILDQVAAIPPQYLDPVP